jgi:hypothetical protein
LAPAPGVISANDSAWETGGRASAFCNPSSTTWRMATIRSPAFIRGAAASAAWIVVMHTRIATDMAAFLPLIGREEALARLRAR